MIQEKWSGCFQEKIASEVSFLVRRYKEELDFVEKQVIGDQLLEMFEELELDYHHYAALLQDIKNKYLFFI